MKKNVVQDVIPPKRSIRNIEIPNKTKGTRVESKPEMPEEPTVVVQDFTKEVKINKRVPTRVEPPVVKQEVPPSYSYHYDEPKKSSRKWLYISLAVLLIVVAFGISAFFKSATIRVAPKQDSKDINDQFTAKKDSTDFGFQVVTISKEALKTIPAGTEQKVEKKAQGTITIYNKTATAQKLIATTRFQTPEGLIFRLVNPVVVPARTGEMNASVIAGHIDAVVVADAVGASYNVGLKDFTIPGFKGDPKYTTVYARSKTEMAGGFSGMQKVASSADVTLTNTVLEGALKEALVKDIVSQIPENFVLYQNSISYSFDPVTQTDSTAEGAVLKKKGTISAIIFDKGTLYRAILTKVAPEVLGDMIKITNLDSLEFSFASSSPFIPSSSTSVTFTLKGTANLVWVFDENKLKSDLLGLSKTNAKTVIGTYPAIKEAWVETRPFWNQTIPSSPEKVTLTNTLAQ